MLGDATSFILQFHFVDGRVDIDASHMPPPMRPPNPSPMPSSKMSAKSSPAMLGSARTDDNKSPSPHMRRRSSLLTFANKETTRRASALEARVLEEEVEGEARERRKSIRRASTMVKGTGGGAVDPGELAKLIKAHESGEGHHSPSHSQGGSPSGKRRASFSMQSGQNLLSLSEDEVAAAMAKEKEDEHYEPATDPMPDSQVDLLNMPSEERESFHIDQIASLLQSTDAFNSVQDELMSEVARCCLYHFFQPGTIICSEDEECAFYFCVVHGSVSVTEPQVSMNEGIDVASISPEKSESAKRRSKEEMGSNRRASKESMAYDAQRKRASFVMPPPPPDAQTTRKHSIGAGKGFHHFPLVMQKEKYEYAAKVTDPKGASIILKIVTTSKMR